MASYDEAIDEYILHLVELAMYSNLLADEVVDMASGRIDELADIITQSGNIRTKRRYKELLSAIDDGQESTRDMVSEKLSSILDNILALALPWVGSLVKPIYKGKVKSPSGMKDKILLATYDSKNSIGDYPSLLSNRIQSLAYGAAKSQYLFSTHSDIASGYVREGFEPLVSGIRTDIPTILDSSVRATERLVYDSIDSVKSLMWVATLDGSTCLVCGNRHGKVFDKGKEPMCPAHHRCRCFLIPSKEATNLVTYQQWISNQSDDTQKKILGKTRYELYKNGMKLDRFVSDGRKLRLDELENR